MTNRTYKTTFGQLEIGAWFEESGILYKRISEHNAQNCLGVRVTFNSVDTVWALVEDSHV